jgi:hypothetical protein
MSRIGKAPITVPGGVDVSIAGGAVTVKGPKGTLSRTVPGAITVRNDAGVLFVERPNDERENRALHGLTRTLVSNMVVGVTDGFSKELEIIGVGYRAEAQSPTTLRLALGYSHPVFIQAPEGDADPSHRPRHRQRSRRSGGSKHPCRAQARALQGQGCPVSRREGPAQGRQDREEVRSES